MTSVAPSWSKAQLVVWQSHLVDNNQYVFQQYFFFVHPIFDSLSAQVHERGGTNADKLFSFPFHLCNVSQAVIPETSFMLHHKRIHHVKPNVMTCLRIFVAWIT